MDDQKLPKPISNQVLIEITKFNDRLKLSDGNELYLETSFEQFKNSPTEGIVVAVPNELRASKRPGYMRYETTMDILVGDIVIFNYLCYHNAAIGENDTTDGKLMEIDNRVYLFVNYESIYLAKRKSAIPYLVAKNLNEREVLLNQIVIDDDKKQCYNIIVLNGFIIFTGIGDIVQTTFLHIPDTVKRNVKQGVVKFIGSKIIKHLVPEGPGDNDDLKVGDVICLPKVGDIPLQYDLHKTLDKFEKYYRIERREVLAVTGNIITDQNEQ
jgi:hypothetical protein